MSALGPRADKAGRVTRRQWLALSRVLHSSVRAPWTHLSFAELHSAGLVHGMPDRSPQGRLLTTKTYAITDAGRVAYRTGYAA